MKKILFIEDDENLAKGIKNFLESENLEVTLAFSLKQAENLIGQNSFDLILMDIALPDGNGMDFYANNKTNFNIPVIFLTAKSSEEDVIRGLELEAEDYIIKSFRMRELLYRIKKVLKRNEIKSTINIGNIQFDENNNIVYKNNKPITLTALEYRLLSILVENRGRLLTRTYILNEIWDNTNNFVNDNTLTVYMKRLRKKIEDDPENPTIIKTVRGIRI